MFMSAIDDLYRMFYLRSSIFDTLPVDGRSHILVAGHLLRHQNWIVTVSRFALVRYLHISAGK